MDVNEAAFVDVATGKLVNSGFLNGMEVAEAKKAIIEYLEKRKHWHTENELQAA